MKERYGLDTSRLTYDPARAEQRWRQERQQGPTQPHGAGGAAGAAAAGVGAAAAGGSGAAAAGSRDPESSGRQCVVM